MDVCEWVPTQRVDTAGPVRHGRGSTGIAPRRVTRLALRLCPYERGRNRRHLASVRIAGNGQQRHRGQTAARSAGAHGYADARRAEVRRLHLSAGLLGPHCGRAGTVPARRGPSGPDELEELLPARASRGGHVPLVQDPQVHYELGRCRGALGAARSFLDETVGEVWNGICSGSPATDADQQRLRLAMQHAMSAGLDAIDVAYRFAGTSVLGRKRAAALFSRPARGEDPFRVQSRGLSQDGPQRPGCRLAQLGSGRDWAPGRLRLDPRATRGRAAPARVS